MKLLTQIELKEKKPRIIVIGDVHGHLAHLHALLSGCSYREGVDYLLFLGDLIDRGPHSLECLRYLRKERVFSCIGNHEFMALTALTGKDEKAQIQWLMNGGKWINSLGNEERNEVVELIRAHMSLALAFRWNDMDIGLIHADFPEGLDWKAINEPPETWHHEQIYEALWSRKRLKSDKSVPVPGIDILLVGHSVVNSIMHKQNVIYLDTGAALIGKNALATARLTAAVFDESLYYVMVDGAMSVSISASETLA